MASTVYIIDGDDILPSRPKPFMGLGSAYRKTSYSFDGEGIIRIPRNQGIVGTNDKLWIAIRKLFQNQRRFVITIFLTESSPGRATCIRVNGPFLEKLRDEYDDFNALKLNLTLRYQSKSRSIDIGLNNMRRNKAIFRTVYSQRSEQLLRRITALPDLQVTMKLTTRVNSLHTRRILSRSLLADKIPFDFHLISENGTKIEFHRNLLAAHSNVFGCPSVQSMNGMQVFVSDCTLLILKNYVYYGLLRDFERDQRIAFELLEAAHFYNISGLERIMKKKLLAMLDTPGIMGVDLAIMLYFFAYKVEIGYYQLEVKALDLIQNTTRLEIVKSDAFQYILRNDEMFGDLVRKSGYIMKCSMEE
ncbi:unnamed protein product [Orchesella dallaii]|uniref:BTB domain-containing protein n=1 Tax=Orchesella dallaii TaxID=48710 RepID=A0ABP1R8R6_9HEXA